MTGTVTKLEWTNPHVWFYIDVTDEQTKQTANWAMEMNSPNNSFASAGPAGPCRWATE